MTRRDGFQVIEKPRRPQAPRSDLTLYARDATARAIVPDANFERFIPLTDHPLSETLAATRAFHRRLVVQSLEYPTYHPIQDKLRELAVLTDEIDALEAVLFHFHRNGEGDEKLWIFQKIWKDHELKMQQARRLAEAANLGVPGELFRRRLIETAESAGGSLIEALKKVCFSQE